MTDKLTRRTVLKHGGLAAGLAGMTSLSGCTGLLGGGGGSVKVSSKSFTEQEILGYLTYETLKENTDVNVQDEVGLGGTTTNFEAVKSDQVDIYWEYTGTAWATLPPKHSKVITDSEEIYEKVDAEFNEEHDLDFLEPAPFNNTYVLVANKEFVEQTGVKTLSEFASHVTSGNTDFTMVMNAEFQQRDDGWPGLAEHYGFGDAKSDINIKNVGSGLTYQAVGQGDAQVGMGFNTNPKIVKFDLTVLEDDEKFFPVYNPAPLVNKAALEENPSIEEPLNAIGPKLTTDKVRNLNKRVSIGDESAQDVARAFLKEHGLI